MTTADKNSIKLSLKINFHSGSIILIVIVVTMCVRDSEHSSIWKHNEKKLFYKFGKLGR